MRRSLIIAGVALALQTGAVQAAEPPAFADILKIDVHAHLFLDVPGLPQMLADNRIVATNVCVRGTDMARMQQLDAAARAQFGKYPQVFPFGSTFDVTQRDADDYVAQVTAWLDETWAAGAVLTKIWKEVGMEIKDRDGNFIMPDDPLFDPIYDHLAQNGKVLLAHLAEPRAAWEPLDPQGAHYPYYSKHPQWHMYGKTGWPSWERIIAARDNILVKHPDLTMIGAHLGSMAYDVNDIATHLDRYDNLYVEVSARTKDLTYQPRQKVRNFMIRYQDRVLYGTDIVKMPGMSDADVPPDQRSEAAEDVINIYRRDYRYFAGTGTMRFMGREVECLNLPVEALEKFYSQNALRLIPAYGTLQ